MPLLKTFGEIKQSRIMEVAGVLAESEDFRTMVNEATDILLQRGDWPGTVVPARFMVRRGCITWPRYVGKVRRINKCHVPMKVGDIWYDFVDRENYLGMCAQCCYDSGTNEWGQNYGVSRGYGSLVNQGKVCTYNDVPSGNPQYIRAYALGPADVGKTVTVYGIDGNGQPLRHQNPVTGDYEDGHIITLAIPYGSSSTTIQRIDAVIKEATQFRVPLYAYDSVTNTLLDLAMYEPGETNPSYSRDRLFDSWAPNCTTQFTVIALVKLAFVPVTVDTDFVLIPSTNALKKAIQSIKYGEAGDINNQEAFMQSAVNELNHVMNNEYPLNQTTVDEGFAGQEFGLGGQAVL